MLPKNNYPSISIIIPTLNSERVLQKSLESIFDQDYPTKLVEIIIVDGGSQDNTLAIIDSFSEEKGFAVRTCTNPLKTGEAGKAVGVRNAANEILAFIDSDNILPDVLWLQRMVDPFQCPEIIATEPLEYIYRRKDGYINRYCALIGMNDPVCLFIGNYDRCCSLTGKWTNAPIQEEDHGNHLHIIFKKNDFLPTIGANGFFIRRKSLLILDIRDYLFDIEILEMVLNQYSIVHVAKVRTGIIHLYCGNFKTFCKKQNRRIMDLYKYSKNERHKFYWDQRKKKGVALFIISCLTFFPLLWQSLLGFLRRPDICWFFHPLACWVTLLIYTYSTIRNHLGFGLELSRNDWAQ